VPAKTHWPKLRHVSEFLWAHSRPLRSNLEQSPNSHCHCACTTRRVGGYESGLVISCGGVLDRKQKQILRSAALSRNSMNYSPQLSNLGRAARKAFYLLLARPEPPWNGPSLIPAGDPYGSRGQRPRKTHPQASPTLKGSNAGDVTPVLRPTAQGNTTPPGSGNERGAFRGRCPRLLSCALAGHEKPALRS
jgi:hypothetical protein